MRATCAFLACMLIPATADASDVGRFADQVEVRVGLAFYDTGLLTVHSYDGVTFNGEFVLPSPDLLAAIGRPRPYVGVDLSNVRNAISFLYGGLTWDYHITAKLHLSASLGIAVNNARNLRSSPNTRSLGSNVGFHVGAAVGYDLMPNLTVQVYTNHFSNAYLAPPNDGHESSGIRLGYRF